MPAAPSDGGIKHDHLQPNTTMTPKEFFEFAKKNDAKMVDLKFTDFLGSWQHCSYPIDTWDEGTFEDGAKTLCESMDIPFQAMPTCDRAGPTARGGRL